MNFMLYVKIFLNFKSYFVVFVFIVFIVVVVYGLNDCEIILFEMVVMVVGLWVY